jgi:uncharacterized protein YjbI with pentapeptide repeats
MLSTKMIGDKITEARKKINISQARLAERLFISAQAVGKWERGESMPDIITFNRLAEILDVDLNYFLQNTVAEPAVIVPQEPLSKGSAEPPSELREKISWDMSSANWVDADFSGLKNLNGKFSSSNMQRCRFIGSDLSGLLLKSNNLDSCDFSGSDISSSQIHNSNLDNNGFKNSSMKAAKFVKSHIQGCDFSGSDFTGCQMQSSHLSSNLFRSTSLKDAEVLKTHLEGSDCSGADFSGLKFRSGGFGNNKITGTTWNHTSFIDMQIADITFEGTLEDCYFEDCVFNWVKFENATLINTFFKNNRFRRVKFADCKADRITYELLKSGKADLAGITLLNL